MYLKIATISILHDNAQVVACFIDESILVRYDVVAVD
jgi:hypothetical protein